MEKVRERTGIYHEHQQGSLCAQHALNNLLQSQVFLADALADIARGLDAEEKSVLTHTSFESENMDDTGFFSIQVLQRAVKMFDLELVPFASQEPVAQQARNHPERVQAYICNLGLHWFTMRRFGRQFFDLNSFYYAPKFIINQMLLPFINLILENGYSVFVVDGMLPHCVAEEQLTANPISEMEYLLLIKDLPQLVMDDKVMGNSKGLGKNGNVAIHLPKHIYDEYEKNPNDPRIRELINAQLPKGMEVKGIVGQTPRSNPQHHDHHSVGRLLIGSTSEPMSDEDLMGVCDCPRHRQHSKVSPQQFKEQVIDDPNTDNPNRSRQQSARITQQIRRYVVTRRDPNNPDGPLQQQIITSSRVIVENLSDPQNDTSTGNRDIRRIPQPSLGMGTDDDSFLEHALAQSLLDESGLNEDITDSFFEDQSEQIYQQSLDKAIAASLQSNNLAIEQSGNTPELIPMTTMNSEPITMKIPPPLTNTHSSPPTNTYFLPPINTSSSSNTFSPHPINTTSPTPTTPNLLPPKTESLPPPPTPNLPVTMSSPSPSTSNLLATTSSPPTLNLLATTSSPATPNLAVTTSSPTIPNLPVTTSSPPTWTPSSPAATSSASPPTPNLLATTASPPSSTTNSLSPTVTNSNFPESPSIEELRLRRQKSHGNRSIISKQPSVDD